MNKIYLVQGTHFNVPGMVSSAHSTQTGANHRAAELVNIMLRDVSIDWVITDGDWSRGLEEVIAALNDGDEADVWILDLELED